MTRTGRAAALLAATASLALAAPAVTVHQAGSHPMRYHLSLPAGWSATRDWPVLVVIPDAGRQFAANLEAFVAARGERPYILVAPEVLTCGGTGSRVLDRYTYTKPYGTRSRAATTSRSTTPAWEPWSPTSAATATASARRSSPGGRRAATRCGHSRSATPSAGAA